jgi:hypothetical protein
MTERKGITRIFNPETQGAVTRQTTVEGRLRESLETKRRIEEEEHPGKHLEASTTDWYGGEGKTVSIEQAAETQLDMQEKLDQHVVDENLGVSHHDSRGQQPCQRVRKGDS